MSVLQITGFLFRAVFETFAAFGIWICLYKKYGGRIMPYLAGILTLMTLVIPRKLLSDLCIPEEGEWAFRIAVSILIGAFCEEAGRYLTMKYFLSDYQKVTDAFCYGLGHGGMELLALSQYSWEFFLASAGLLSESPERMQRIAEIRFSDNAEAWINSCDAIIMHVALSVMVHISVRQQKKKYFFLAVLMHTMANISELYGGVAFDIIWTAVLCCLTCKIYYQNKGVLEL